MSARVMSATWPHPIYGLTEIKPIVAGVPDNGRIRIRLRNNDWAWAFVKTDRGIRKFVIGERVDGNWELVYEQQRNHRP